MSEMRLGAQYWFGGVIAARAQASVWALWFEVAEQSDMDVRVIRSGCVRDDRISWLHKLAWTAGFCSCWLGPRNCFFDRQLLRAA